MMNKTNNFKAILSIVVLLSSSILLSMSQEEMRKIEKAKRENIAKLELLMKQDPTPDKFKAWEESTDKAMEILKNINPNLSEPFEERADEVMVETVDDALTKIKKAFIAAINTAKANLTQTMSIDDFKDFDDKINAVYTVKGSIIKKETEKDSEKEIEKVEKIIANNTYEYVAAKLKAINKEIKPFHQMLLDSKDKTLVTNKGKFMSFSSELKKIRNDIKNVFNKDNPILSDEYYWEESDKAASDALFDEIYKTFSRLDKLQIAWADYIITTFLIDDLTINPIARTSAGLALETIGNIILDTMQFTFNNTKSENKEYRWMSKKKYENNKKYLKKTSNTLIDNNRLIEKVLKIDTKLAAVKQKIENELKKKPQVEYENIDKNIIDPIWNKIHSIEKINEDVYEALNTKFNAEVMPPINDMVDVINNTLKDINETNIAELIKNITDNLKDKGNLDNDKYDKITVNFKAINDPITKILLTDKNPFLQDVWYKDRLDAETSKNMSTNIITVIDNLYDLFDDWTNYINNQFIKNKNNLITDVANKVDEPNMAKKALTEMATNIIELVKFTLDNSKNIDGKYLWIEEQESKKEYNKIETKKTIIEDLLTTLK